MVTYGISNKNQRNQPGRGTKMKVKGKKECQRRREL